MKYFFISRRGTPQQQSVSQQQQPQQQQQQTQPSQLSPQQVVTKSPPPAVETSEPQNTNGDNQAAPAQLASPPKQVTQRVVSLPASPQERYRPPTERRLGYSQSERLPTRERPRFARSTSRKEAIKNYIKRETANFFGVDEESEASQQLRWLDRRKRLASR